MRVAVVLVLGGCDFILGLEKNPVFEDAAIEIDANEGDAAPGCWTNLRQDHDEDGDGVKDGCDNCPVHANAAQTNDDGDEVGNACDPGTGMHRIAFFRSFDKQTDMLGMNANGGTWAISNDSVVQSNPSGASLGVQQPFRNAIVYTRVRNLTVPSIGIAEAGVYASTSEQDWLQCVARNTFNRPSSVHFERIGAGAATAADLDHVLGPSIGIELRVADATNMPRCALDTTEDAELALGGIGPSDGYTALYTGFSTGEFLYLLVIAPML